jgi:hypothetical protein
MIFVWGNPNGYVVLGSARVLIKRILARTWVKGVHVRLAAASMLALALAAPVGAAEGEAVLARLRIEVGPGPARAGEPAKVRIHTLGARGEPEDVKVALDADGGEVSPPRRVSPGVMEALLTVPARLPAGRSILLLARTDEAHAELSVALVPGPPATATLDGVDTCAEGSENCPLVLRVEDAGGNGIDERPQVRAERGRIVSVSERAPGQWVLAYRAPRLEREVRDEVVATVGQVKAAHVIRLTPSRTRLALAFRGGLARQDGHLGPAAGGQLFFLGNLGGWLGGGGLELGWWRVQHSGTATGTSLELTTARSELALGACGVAERALGRAALTWVSATAGLGRVQSSTTLSGQPAVTAAKWAPTAGAGAALGWRTRVGIPFVEVRGAWTGDPRLATVSGASGAVLLQLGYRFDAR